MDQICRKINFDELSRQDKMKAWCSPLINIESVFITTKSVGYGAEADKHVFKVPGLRNIALTAPYFHNGSVKTLPEAIDVMFKFQLGRPAPEEDKALIVAFLKTLTGETLEKPTEPVQAENKQ